MSQSVIVILPRWSCDLRLLQRDRQPVLLAVAVGLERFLRRVLQVARFAAEAHAARLRVSVQQSRQTERGVARHAPVLLLSMHLHVMLRKWKVLHTYISSFSAPSSDAAKVESTSHVHVFPYTLYVFMYCTVLIITMAK